jgi:hypothetical protein
MALPSNTSPGWRGLQGANPLSYLPQHKKFYDIDTRALEEALETAIDEAAVVGEKVAERRKRSPAVYLTPPVYHYPGTPYLAHPATQPIQALSAVFYQPQYYYRLFSNVKGLTL